MTRWIVAARPQTLSAAICPVLLGSAFAWKAGSFNLWIGCVILSCALLIQIGTNFANDYFDFKKGADTSKRLGPQRMTQSGIISEREMRNAFILVFALSVVLGLILVLRGGWPIFWIGIASVASGILYTGGPKPLGYLGLGDLFVLIFFGPVAVLGTYYLYSFHVDLTILIAGLAPGFFSVAVLAVNNLRDMDEDRLSGKKTLAVRFGRQFAQFEYLSCVITACIIPFLIFLTSRTLKFHPIMLISCFAFLFGISPMKLVLTQSGAQLNPALGKTAKLLLIFTLVLSLLILI